MTHIGTARRFASARIAEMSFIIAATAAETCITEMICRRFIAQMGAKTTFARIALIVTTPARIAMS